MANVNRKGKKKEISQCEIEVFVGEVDTRKKKIVW